MSILRNRWAWLIAILVVIGLGIVLNPLGIGKATAPTYNVEAVRRADLVASVNSSGSVQPNADVALTFQTAGQITDIMVKNGDAVEKGQKLAQLDTRDLSLQVQQAEANLKQAQANLAKLQVGPSAKDIANAQAALDSAKAQLAKVKSGPGTPQDVAAAQAQVDQAKANLAKVKLGATTQDIAAAEATVRQAQAKLDALKQPANPSDIQAAQAALDAAQAQYDKVKAGATADQLSAAQSKVTQAQNNLDGVKANYASQKQQAQIAIDQAANALRNAQDNLNQVYQQTHDNNGNFRTDPPGRDGYFEELYNQALRTEQDAEGVLAKARDALANVQQQEIAAVNTAEATLSDAQTALAQLKTGPTAADLSQAQSAIDQAKAKLDSLKRGASAQDLAAAQAAVDQAQANLNKLKVGPTKEDIAAAQAQVDQATANLEKAKRGATAEDVAQAQASVDQAQNTLDDLKAGAKPTDLAPAQAAVDQSQAALDQAKLRLSNATLVAPFKGIAASVPLNVGQNVGVGTLAVNLIDNTRYHVDVNVNESDVAGVKLGAKVSVTFDSMPDTPPITGTVIFISPKGSTQAGNVVAYLVTVLIDQQGQDASLRVGLTANTAIITAREANALVIPQRLVRTEDVDNVVYVLKGGQAVRTVIKLGLSNEEDVQVVSGLNDGDQIITNPPAARSSTLKINGGGSGSSGGNK